MIMVDHYEVVGESFFWLCYGKTLMQFLCIIKTKATLNRKSCCLLT